MSIITLANLPPWTLDYEYQVTNSIVRTPDNVRGKVQQARNSNIRRTVVSATRQLKRSEIMYFEYFVRVLCNEGTHKFNDSYIDGAGLQTGIVRILDGKYDVTTDLLNHTITCDIEVFR